MRTVNDSCLYRIRKKIFTLTVCHQAYMMVAGVWRYVASNSVAFLRQDINGISIAHTVCRAVLFQSRKLFFEFGANPDILYEVETLYDHVLWEVFNDSITPHDWEYIKKFFIFLVAYGGGKEASRYGLPNLTEPIDKNRIYEYDFKLVPCEDGYHLEGHIIAPDGKDIGAV